MELDELEPQDVATHLESYLSEKYGKRLEANIHAELCRTLAIRQPFFARTVFDELRHLGNSDAVFKYVNALVSRTDTQSLTDLMLERWIIDYDVVSMGGPLNLVQQILSLMGTARIGLAELELRVLLGSRQAPLATLFLSPVLLALEGWSIDRAGLLALSSAELRGAVERKWLTDESVRRQRHQQLAAFFAEETNVRRKADELPWHLAAAHDWQGLQHLLADLRFLTDAWATHGCSLLRWWERLEQHMSVSRVDVFRPAINGPPKDFDLLQTLCLVVEDCAGPHDLLGLSEALLQAAPMSSRDAIHDAMVFRAKVLCRQLMFEEAHGIYRRLEDSCRKSGDNDGLATALAQQAHLARETGRTTETIALYAEAMNLFTQSNNYIGQCDILGSLVSLHGDSGNLKEALRLSSKLETLCRQTGNQRDLLQCFRSRARIWDKKAKRRRALRDVVQAATLADQLGDWHALESCLGDKARILVQLEQYSEVVDTIFQRISLCDRYNLLAGRIDSRLQLAHLYQELGQFSASQKWRDEAVSLTDAVRQHDSSSDNEAQ